MIETTVTPAPAVPGVLLDARQFWRRRAIASQGEIAMLLAEVASRDEALAANMAAYSRLLASAERDAGAFTEAEAWREVAMRRLGTDDPGIADLTLAGIKIATVANAEQARDAAIATGNDAEERFRDAEKRLVVAMRRAHGAEELALVSKAARERAEAELATVRAELLASQEALDAARLGAVPTENRGADVAGALADTLQLVEDLRAQLATAQAEAEQDRAKCDAATLAAERDRKQVERLRASSERTFAELDRERARANRAEDKVRDLQQKAAAKKPSKGKGKAAAATPPPALEPAALQRIPLSDDPPRRAPQAKVAQSRPACKTCQNGSASAEGWNGYLCALKQNDCRPDVLNLLYVRKATP